MSAGHLSSARSCRWRKVLLLSALLLLNYKILVYTCYMLYAYTKINVFMLSCIYLSIYIYIYIYMYLSLYLYIYIYIYIYMYSFISLSIHICIWREGRQHRALHAAGAPRLHTSYSNENVCFVFFVVLTNQ